MAEENQVRQEPQQVTKEPQRVTTKDPQQVQQVTTKNPNKVKAGKSLAEYNQRKREEKKAQSKASGGVNQYYGIGAVIAVGVIGGLGYHIYRTKKGQATTEWVQAPVEKYQIILLNRSLNLTSLRWIKSLLYYKNGQEEYSK